MSAPVYRWVPGMRTASQLGSTGGLVTDIIANPSRIRVLFRDNNADYFRFDERDPDIDDPGTRAHLLEQVRERTGDPGARTQRVDRRWHVYSRGESIGSGDTEGLAIMDALKRAKAKPPEQTEAEMTERQRNAYLHIINRVRCLFDLDPLDHVTPWAGDTIESMIEQIRNAARKAGQVDAAKREVADRDAAIAVLHKRCRAAEHALDAVTRQAVADLDTLEHYRCDVCKQLVPWDSGGNDDMPGTCDDCWMKAHESEADPCP